MEETESNNNRTVNAMWEKISSQDPISIPFKNQNEKMVKDGNLLRGRKLVKLKATKYVTTVLIFIYPIFFQL